MLNTTSKAQNISQLWGVIVHLCLYVCVLTEAGWESEMFWFWGFTFLLQRSNLLFFPQKEVDEIPKPPFSLTFQSQSVTYFPLPGQVPPTSPNQFLLFAENIYQQPHFFLATAVAPFSQFNYLPFVLGHLCGVLSSCCPPLF